MGTPDNVLSRARWDFGYTHRALTDLIACPFCRELFAPGEAQICPCCGLPLSNLASLPASYDALVEEDWPREPEWEPLAPTYWRRSRGALVLAGCLGVFLFFAPWVHVTVPETMSLSGLDVARRTVWPWACLVSWLMLVATALSRRSVAKMRGARVAASLFSAIPLTTAIVLFVNPPRSSLIPLRFTWGYGILATLAVSVAAIPFAVRFGGKLDELATQHGTSKGQTLH